LLATALSPRAQEQIIARDFHDHLLHGDKVISAVRDYIRNNPANWQMDKENSPNRS
jgi:hypothetical protein